MGLERFSVKGKMQALQHLEGVARGSQIRERAENEQGMKISGLFFEMLKMF